MARITIYKNSFLASLVSILGYLFIVGGILTAFNEDIIVGIILAVVGIGFAIWAGAISENKKFKTWKKQVESNGYVPRIQSDINFAITVYNTYPCTKALDYISTINPAAGRNISAQLAAKKK